ncbi:MAG TPA: ATP-dependent helicase [Blastocatellia bacterium]|nr:ATP-dependent helicase [Blastocatellia bacterium]
MARSYTIKRHVAAEFRVDYARSLNSEQYKVVTAGEGPILVVAGAGSGKTRTVTYRVARLIECGVEPRRILLATFTNKAAHQMLTRVEGLVQSDAGRVWGGTFHSIANKILRRHAASLGYQSSFSILDSEDSRDLVELSILQSGIDQKSRRFPNGSLVAEMISAATNRDISLRECLSAQYPQFAVMAKEIEYVAGVYQQQKLSRNSMDYDDLLFNWKRLLLDDPEIAGYWQDRFQHILVDEYQDTNKLQAEIVDLMAAGNRNIMVVGDDAQSIFRWRGAHFANIYTFKERYLDAQEYHLEMNYRSRPEIVLLANASIRNNRHQFPKSLQAVRDSTGVAPALVPLGGVDQQAAFVASRVLELREEGIPLSEIAVLYRSHWHSMELQIELVRRGVPYVVRSGVRFFEQAHIKDVMAYLRIVTNPKDELAWKRVLRLIPHVGARTSARILRALAECTDPLELVKRPDFVPRSRAAPAWRDFAGLLWRLTSTDSLNRPASQIETVLVSGYLEHLRAAYENAEQRSEDLRQLANYAVAFDSTEEFISGLALINSERFSPPRGVVGEDPAKSAGEEEKMVLSSIHQAKGLEWRAVFLIWVVEGKFPSTRSLHDPEGEEEERRLFYVAATRAKDELYVCYPVMQAEYSRGAIIQKPSRFITELPQQLFERWTVREQGIPERS